MGVGDEGTPVTTGSGRAGPHGCAVLSSEEQGWEVLAEFIGDGIEGQDQVVVVGLRAGQVTELRRRLREEQGVDPVPAIADGQLVLVDEAVSAGFFRLSGQDLTGMVTDQVGRALIDGYRGVRLTGLYPERGVGPHELALDRLVRAVPLTVLCGYFAGDVTEQELLRIRGLHSREVVDPAVYDDGRLRITRPRPGWLRLAGRWDTGNHEPALTAVAQAVTAGDRDLDVASLRSIDPASLHALLTGIGRVRLRRPNHLVQQLAHYLSTQRPPQPTTPGGSPSTNRTRHEYIETIVCYCRPGLADRCRVPW